MSLFGEIIPTDLKNNLTATTAPTVNDDKSEGYQVLSQWVVNDVTIYECADNTVGAAVWNAINVAGGGTSYQDDWDASTNTPTLADGTGTAGDFYVVNVAGTQNLGSGDQEFSIGDQVIYNSSDIWKKQDTGVSYVPVDKAGDTMTGNLSVPSIDIDNITADGNSITITDTDGNLTLIPNGTGHVDINEPPASEASGIDIGGTTYDSAFRVNDIGGSAPAQAILHRHSTTLAPVLVGARTNNDTDSHTSITAGQSTLSLYGAGWTGSHYDLTSQIDFSADTGGTISATSAPGRIRLMTSPDGSNVPVTALTVDKDQKTTFAGNVDISGVSIDGGDLGANTPITSAVIDSITINGQTVSVNATDTDLYLSANGTGSIFMNNIEVGDDQWTTLAAINQLNGLTTTSDVEFAQITCGNIVTTGNVDGRDVSSDGDKLDLIEDQADVTDAANVTAAGALMDSELADVASVKAINQGLATTDSPTFDDVNAGGDVLVGSPAATKGIQLRAQGNIELVRDDSLGHIDFKTLNADDYDCRIIQESNGLKFAVGGSGNTIVSALVLASSGDVTIEKNVSANAVNTGTNSQTITANKTLVATDAQDQTFINNTSDLDVILPAGVEGMSFILSNDSTSTFNIAPKYTGGVTVAASDVAPGVAICLKYINSAWVYR